MARCSNCNTELPDEDSPCLQCGTRPRFHTTSQGDATIPESPSTNGEGIGHFSQSANTPVVIGAIQQIPHALVRGGQNFFAHMQRFFNGSRLQDYHVVFRSGPGGYFYPRVVHSSMLPTTTSSMYAIKVATLAKISGAVVAVLLVASVIFPSSTSTTSLAHNTSSSTGQHSPKGTATPEATGTTPPVVSFQPTPIILPSPTAVPTPTQNPSGGGVLPTPTSIAVLPTAVATPTPKVLSTPTYPTAIPTVKPTPTATPTVKPTPTATPPSITVKDFPLPSTDFGSPSSIVSGPDGNLWFTSLNSDQIGRLSTSGTSTSFRPAGESEAMTVGPDGNLWFTSTSFIGRITPSGTIQMFKTNLSNLLGITTGPDGNLWFAGDNIIGVMSPSGSIIKKFPLPNPDSNAEEITVGPDKNLWFTESVWSGPTVEQIGRITPSGVIQEFPLPDQATPKGIVTGFDGNIWFANGPKIGRITPSGVLRQFPLPTPGTGTTTIAHGPDGNLWFDVDTGENRGNGIGRITSSGTITTFPIDSTGDLGPNSIIIGSDGNLWCTTDFGIDRISI